MDEREEGFVGAAERPRRHPHQLLAGTRPRDAPRGEVGLPGERAGGLHSHIQSLFALAQRLLGPFTLGDVVRDIEETRQAVEREYLDRAQPRYEIDTLWTRLNV